MTLHDLAQQPLKLTMTNENLNLDLPVAVDGELGVPLIFRASLSPKALCWHLSSSLRSLSGRVRSHRGTQKNSQLPNV